MKYTFLLFVFALLLGCHQEDELKQITFEEDPEAYGLPKYSEWGYNTFGAYFANEYFIAKEDIEPFHAIHEGNVTSFHFSGELDGYYGGPLRIVTMIIAYEGFNPEKYQDFVALDNVELDLTNAAHKVFIVNDDGTHEVEVLSGRFHIKRAQHLFVDKVSTQAIISGVFEMNIVINGATIIVRNGRFDVGVSDETFVKK